MKLDFTIDMTCPWCYIGLKRLQQAMGEHPEHNFNLCFFGYQLMPELGDEGITYQDNLKRLIPDEEKRQAAHKKIVSIGEELGICFRFDRKLIVCNTLKAHQLLKACPQEKQMELLEKIFAGIFTHAMNLGHTEQLAAIATEIGLPLTINLEKETSKQAVLADFHRSSTTPIITIPYLVIEERFPVQAAHLPQVISACIRNML
ncbi:MAG: DsbA family protein [Oligoflexia bacterium]|nr:DsbA family protein [Oligoflexia bacterium]